MSGKPDRDNKPSAADALLGDLESIRALLEEHDAEASGDARDLAQTARLRRAAPPNDDDEIPMLDDAIDDEKGEPESGTDAGDHLYDDELFEKAFADEFAAEFDEAMEDQALEDFMRRQEAAQQPPQDRSPDPGPGNEPRTDVPADWQRPPPGSAMTDDLIKALLDDEWRDSAAGLVDKTRKPAPEGSRPAEPQLDQRLRQRLEQELDQWLAETIERRLPALRERLLKIMEAELSARDQRRNNQP
jgi:hypothetical protein